MRACFSAVAIFLAVPALAETPDIGTIVDGHVLPGYRLLETEAMDLANAAASDCAPTSEGLRDAYHDAFDAWVGVSHLRFGPSETEDRSFALAFWPDPRGSTPKTLGGLISAQDPVIETPEDFATVSVAVRGFYALEFLLFDPQFAGDGIADYRCALLQAVTLDISANASAILDGWENGYGALMSNPGNDTYRTATEAAQQFFTALSTGLEFTSDTRLARPLGTFDRPRPNRAEARRSGRSLRHVVLSLEATRALAALLSEGDAEVDAAFQSALRRATDLDDPVFEGVADPGKRFKVEALRQDIVSTRRLLLEGLGPRLGITAGFNSLDGD
ncbi:MAG: imelysin family protein [Pseudomonadota bacterium]